MKKFSLVLCVLIITILSVSVSVVATASEGSTTAGGFYDISSVDKVTIVPASSGAQMTELSADVDNDGEADTFYANSDKLTVTYTGASEGEFYGVMLVQGSDIPTKDDEIFYIGQETATSGTVTFDVYPKLPEDTTELTLYISSSKENDTLVSVDLNYVKEYTYGTGTTPPEQEETLPTFSNSMQANLTLEANVYLNVYFKLENLGTLNPQDLVDRVGLLVWDADSAPETENATYENREEVLTDVKYDSEEGSFKVRSEGIPAKELGDAITFRPYLQNKDGSYTYGKIVPNYCPSKYCYGQLKDSNTDDDELMVTILNYGASAQEFFNYNTESLMNADLTDDQKLITWDGSLVRSDWSVPEEKAGELVRNRDIITSRTANLTLLGAIDYNFQIAVNNTVDVANVKILCWTEDAYNAADVLTESNATRIEAMTYNEEEGTYDYKYAGLPAKRMFSPIYTCAVVTDTEGNEYYGGVVPYCPERFAYISTTSNDVSDSEKKLAKCIAIYGDAARTYFSK